MSDWMQELMSLYSGLLQLQGYPVTRCQREPGCARLQA
jgi:hypothetical protein